MNHEIIELLEDVYSQVSLWCENSDALCGQMNDWCRNFRHVIEIEIPHYMNHEIIELLEDVYSQVSFWCENSDALCGQMNDWCRNFRHVIDSFL